MAVDVILGLQWGDEGKGKIVDVFTPKYDIVARFQGGPNAGHTLVIQGKKSVLHLIPSGIFHTDTQCVIGNGVVLDPITLKKEIEALLPLVPDVKERLLISERAHIILPSHKLLDAASEASKGAAKIGSTLRGITPTYMDKTGRNGLRVGDVKYGDFDKKYEQLLQKHKHLLDTVYQYEYDLGESAEEFAAAIAYLRELKILDTSYFLNKNLQEGKRILAEGAQGTLLDVEFGSYPYVTSSTTTTSGACAGLGISPSQIGKVFGIFKAYCTRVGSGPFPTELNGTVGEKLREAGGEYGATTGRPRRCGWLDLVALKYAVQINGVTDLVMTKADVLDAVDSIQVCNSYTRTDGTETQEIPYDFAEIQKPVYAPFEVWKKDISGIRNTNDLPSELETYIRHIESYLGVPVSILSVGPGREQTMSLSPAYRLS